MYKPIWHNLGINEVIKILKTHKNSGLTEEEVISRQKKLGKNEIPKERKLSLFEFFLHQFKSPLIYILLFAGIITLFLKEFTDSGVIFGAVFLNAIIGVIQEKKASDALGKLKQAIRHRAVIIRGGNIQTIDSEKLLPGDIVLLSSGNKVPADGRIIETKDLKISEIVLTGEWIPSPKNTECLDEKKSLADRDNMAYMGTTIEEGQGKMVITEIGSDTEIGKLATLVKKTKEEKTPLQKKLIKFSRFISIFVLIISIVIFLSGFLNGSNPSELFILAVAVAVAAIPEGLPIAMTVILALGMKRILEKGGLVRKLVSAETLGSTSVICSDKTATLTQGKMEVTKFLTNRKDDLIFKIALLCNEAFIENIKEKRSLWKISGRPTDRAILNFGINSNLSINKIKKELPKIDSIPFNSSKKYLATLHKDKDKNLLFVAGAPENILSFSNLSLKEKNKWKKELENIAEKGYRTVSLAFKKTNEEKIKESSIKNLEFVALLRISDPLRADAKKSIKESRLSGIRPIIITGDHKLTAQSIAEELGINITGSHIIEGKELDQMSDEELSRKISNINVYARLEPKHKTRIVNAWQKKGEVVAMTGDGVNDAPALKKADIGISLSSGTEVAKEIADLVLLNDNFSVIIASVEEGRSIIRNIRKVITYHLADSFTEIILVLTSILLGLPLPIIAVQILWINLIEDGPMGLVLAFEPKEEGLIKQKPEGHKVPLLTKEMKSLIFIIGIITDLILIAIFFFLLKSQLGYTIEHIRTVIFAALTIDSLLYIFSCKSLRKNLWQINLFSNKLLLIAWFFGVIMLLLSIYSPIFQSILKTVSLNKLDWIIILAMGLLEIILIEATKWFFISKKDFE